MLTGQIIKSHELLVINFHASCTIWQNQGRGLLAITLDVEGQPAVNGHWSNWWVVSVEEGAGI